MMPWEFAVETVSNAYSHIRSLAQPALFFLLISIFINRRNLRDVLLRLLPRSTRVNLTSYLIDMAFIAGPVGYCAFWITGFMKTRGLVLPVNEVIGLTPAFLIAVLAVFFGDLIGYFRHRLEHSTVLWPTHAMHHADAHMNWMTLFRFHPLNRLTTTLIDTVALVALGFPPWAIVVNSIVRHNYGLFVHANVPWTLGPLGILFVSPAMHRWHHVRSGPGVSCNFATIFSVFDRAMGTHYVPGPCNVPTGVDGINDQSYVAQLTLPLTALISSLRTKATREIDAGGTV